MDENYTEIRDITEDEVSSSPTNSIPNSTHAGFLNEDDNSIQEPNNINQYQTDPVQEMHVQLIPWSAILMQKPILNELVERKLKLNQSFTIGRQVKEKEGQAIIDQVYNPLDVWFTSKVVSRVHAQIVFKDGQV